MHAPGNGHTDIRQAGFTLVEVMVTSVISLLIFGATMALFVTGMWIYQEQAIRAELNQNLESAMERIRADLRLSSVGIGLMSFYPQTAAEYTAISIPLADDSNGDGLLDRDPSTGKIAWKHTVIYHVRPGNPDKLLRTEFYPRMSNATPAQVYNQLVAVVAASNASQLAAAALSGESCQSKTVFENLVRMTFSPPNTRYDGYNASVIKDDPFNWGSLVLSGGLHRLAFKVEGRNTASTGYVTRIDAFRLSASASQREGESYVPANTHPTTGYFNYSTSGGTVRAEQPSSTWSFSGNAGLVFAGTATNNTLTLDVYNDLWCDNNFDSPGAVLASNCSVKFDTSFAATNPNIPDVVVSMDKGVAWVAASVSDGNASQVIEGQTLQVTNILYGGTNQFQAITRNGQWARVSMASGSGAPTYLTNALLSDTVTGASTGITFNAGQRGVLIAAQTNLWSDWVPEFVIDKSRNYRVAFQIGGMPGTDSDNDLFVGRADGTIYYQENRGTPTAPSWGPASNAWLGVDYGTYSAPAFGDLDGDGDLDMIVGGWNGGAGNVQYWRNTGTIAAPTMALVDNNWKGFVLPLGRPALADIDGDGDLDFFCGSRNGRILFMPNNGTNWGAADPVWKGIGVYQFSDPSESLNYTAPTFGDLDGDGDLDLIVGRFEPGDMVLFVNTGTKFDAQFGVTNLVYTGYNAGRACVPALADLDGDGDLDLLVGNEAGTVTFLRNTGSPTAAQWGETNLNFNAINVGGWSAPRVVNINPNINSLSREYVASGTLATTNGVAHNAYIAASQLEVGYPSNAVFRSGIFDTHVDAPPYGQLNWTRIERAADGGKVDVRVRSGNQPDLSDATETSWTDAKATDSGYFTANTGNSLATLLRRRYVQYEARLKCTAAQGHTNTASAILRDVTIDWPGPTGLVDLLVDFGKGPDGAIISATVDGRTFSKGVTMEMEIYKDSRRGTQTARGVLEVRPLNTGK